MNENDHVIYFRVTDSVLYDCDKDMFVLSNTSEAVAGVPGGVFFGANDTSFPPNPKVTPTGVFNHLGAFLRAASETYIKSESHQLLCHHTKFIHRTTLRCRRIQLIS